MLFVFPVFVNDSSSFVICTAAISIMFSLMFGYIFTQLLLQLLVGSLDLGNLESAEGMQSVFQRGTELPINQSTRHFFPYSFFHAVPKKNGQNVNSST